MAAKTTEEEERKRKARRLKGIRAHARADTEEGDTVRRILMGELNLLRGIRFKRAAEKRSRYVASPPLEPPKEPPPAVSPPEPPEPVRHRRRSAIGGVILRVRNLFRRRAPRDRETIPLDGGLGEFMRIRIPGWLAGVIIFGLIGVIVGALL